MRVAASTSGAGIRRRTFLTGEMAEWANVLRVGESRNLKARPGTLLKISANAVQHWITERGVERCAGTYHWTGAAWAKQPD